MCACVVSTLSYFLLEYLAELESLTRYVQCHIDARTTCQSCPDAALTLTAGVVHCNSGSCKGVVIKSEHCCLDFVLGYIVDS